MRPNSAGYEAILNWVRSGAPYGEEGEASGRVVRVEVEPDEVVLAPEGKHRLLVTAHLSNGQQEDITDQVLYASNNSEVVKVDEQGQVAAVRTGETSVITTVRLTTHGRAATDCSSISYDCFSLAAI